MNEEKETGRIEAFSDGVFAIAITLLVLEIKVPHIADLGRDTLAQKLLYQWPMYLAFTISFLTILIMWINHHRLFTVIKRSDDRFLLLNGLLLMTVTLVPFPTELMAEFIRHRDAATALHLYTGLNIVMAVCFSAVWKYASTNNRLLAHNHDPRIAEGISKQYRFGPLFYVATFLLAFVSAAASVGLCALLAIFFAVSPAAIKQANQ